jgi:adenylyl- and sulfurtransferase ThiI
LAKKIWTYTISIQPHDDCCSLIAGDTAWTKWRIGVLEKMEEEIMMSIVEDKTMDGVEKMIITNW